MVGARLRARLKLIFGNLRFSFVLDFFYSLKNSVLAVRSNLSKPLCFVEFSKKSAPNQNRAYCWLMGKKGLFVIPFDFNWVSYPSPFQADIWKLMGGKIGVKLRWRRAQESTYRWAQGAGNSGVFFSCVWRVIAACFGRVKCVDSSGVLEWESLRSVELT